MNTSLFISKIALAFILICSLEACAQTNLNKEREWTYLMYAIDDGNLSLAKKLINKGENLNFENNRGYTPLLLAISEEELEIVNLLLEKGVPINYTSSKGHTSLNVACRDGNFEIVEFLLDNGAKINPESTLMNSVSGENMSVVELILKKNSSNVNAAIKNTHFCCSDNKEESYKIEWHNWSSLLEAVHENQLEISKLLIDYGANVNIEALKEINRLTKKESISGWKPIFEAIQNNNLSMVKLLMENGTDINSKLSTGETILEFANKQGNESIIKAISAFIKK